MQDLDAFQLVAVGAYGSLAFIYAVLVPSTWRWSWRVIGPAGYRLVPLVCAGGASYCAALVVMSVVPGNLWRAPPAWLLVLCVVSDWILIPLQAATPHLWRLVGHRNRRPGLAWLLANYSPAVLLCGLTVASPLVLPGTPAEQSLGYLALRYVASVVWFGLAAFEVRLPLRTGAWHPGFRTGPVDFAAMAGVVVVLVVVPLFMPSWDPTNPPQGLEPGVGFGYGLALRGPERWSLMLLQVGLSLLVLLPWIRRTPGDLVRLASIGGGMVMVVVAALFGTLTATRPLVDAGLTRLSGILVVIVALAVAGLAPSGLKALIDKLLLGRRLQRWEHLQTIVRTLPAEEGVVMCCQRFVDVLVAERLIGGAAILLDDRVAVGAGRVAMESIRALWPWDSSAPAQSPAGTVLPRPGEELPDSVTEAFAESGITTVVEIASPRRRWGCLCFGTVSRFTILIADEERQAASLGAQFALVLDAAFLLQRTVAVERALAHAAKLAAVGETAARIAHEIRNPVTAARSLAQMLARRPDSPRTEERAELVLRELERVEHQVASLLSFSRREEFRFEAVALDTLVRATLAGLKPRLEEACVEVALDLAEGAVARADGEKIRQVLVNLIQNSIDAMVDHPAPRRLDVVVTRANGTASLLVSDTGGGIPPDLLPQVFEPFRSGKAKGTGLGLAIAKQLVEAHGGQIAVTLSREQGTTVEISLPLIESFS